MSSNKVRKHYAEYVTKGGDGPSVFETRASDLGYGFVDKSGHTLLRNPSNPMRVSGGHPVEAVVPSNSYTTNNAVTVVWFSPVVAKTKVLP